MASIEIDGKKLDVENGKSIIEVADDAGIHIPRFCYHKKLSVAANCRMCLVAVENGRKTVPACATPVTDGMKVFTKSEEALKSQKAVMEFLLINHPLDCPICDQGGECELQDVSVGFGRDSSEYQESKRAVNSDNLGSLIATEMTRCIHCTRCVRFGDEVAGLRELGGTHRGEEMKIGTYVKHSMKSEVSGNIIDLCPVGALTSKPFQYSARAWEMSQLDSVAPHDCLGSNVHLHTRRNKLMRVVPRENDNINETWLSDRDRYSYLGINSKNRAGHPQIKQNGQWKQVDWQTALKFATDGIAKVLKAHGSEHMSALASPSATLEELYILQKLMREIGVNNIDHRIQQMDFRDQNNQPAMPTSSLIYSELENQDAILIIGSNIQREVPLAGIRLRKASLNNAKIYAINPVNYDMNFELADKKIVVPNEIATELAKIIICLVDNTQDLPEQIQSLILGLEADDTSKAIAASLRMPNAVIVTGAISENMPDASLIRTFISIITELTHAKTLRLTHGSNSAGAWLAGMIPHRGVAGKSIEAEGLNAKDSIDAKLKCYLLMGVEPEFDFLNPFGARQAMIGAEFVVMLSAFDTESMREYADVILPIAPFAETSGTYINVDQTWQTVKGAIAPFEDSRPAWKVLRVLGNFMHKNGFDYDSSEGILAEIKSFSDVMAPSKYLPFYPESILVCKHKLVRVGEWPLYRNDAIVRNAQALQDCAAAEQACIRVHPATASRLKLDETATVSQGDIEITLPLKRDERVAQDVVWVANAMPETADLGHAFSAITIKR